MFNYFVHNAFLNKLSSFIVNSIIKYFRIFFRKNTNSKVLVVVIHKIGDSVFTLHAINKIIEIFGDEITILCSTNTVPIYKRMYPIANILGVEYSKDFYFERIANSYVRQIVKEVNAGTVIDLTGNIKSATALFFSKAKIISGFNEREHFNSLYTHYVPKRTLPKLLDMYFDPIKVLHSFDVNENDIIFPINKNPLGYILIHPFAGWKAKEWDFNNFIDLAKMLNGKYKCKFVGEEKSFTSDYLNKMFEAKIEFVFTKDLDELFTALQKSALLVSNDSGPVHIASMLGIPTFTIFGPTNPLFILPSGKYHKFIRNEVECAPIGNKLYCDADAGRNGCNYFKCIKELSVNQVNSDLEAFISKLEIVNKKITAKQ